MSSTGPMQSTPAPLSAGFPKHYRLVMRRPLWRGLESCRHAAPPPRARCARGSVTPLRILGCAASVVLLALALTVAWTYGGWLVAAALLASLVIAAVILAWLMTPGDLG